MKFNTIHKIRFDRGRIYWSYINAIVTAILVNIFILEINVWYKIGSGLASFVIIYLLGYFDDKFKIIDREQKNYADKNPAMQKILDDLNEIKEKLKQPCPK